MLTGLVLGEPERHREPTTRSWAGGDLASRSSARSSNSFAARARSLVLLFILVHKIGDTLANLTFRLLFDDLGYSNDEIAIYDVGVGFWALSDRHLRRRRALCANGPEALGADRAWC